MILISTTITLSVHDGNTVTSTDIYGTDKKTYVNIGSGNVFKLEWTTPTLGNDIVDRYSLVIKRYDTTLNVYYDIFDKNIGLINEFYVDASLLPVLPLQYMLSVYVVAYGKYGSVVTSNTVNPYISKGTGNYVNVKPADYKQPIMKRALAFVYTPTPAAIPAVILDEAGNEVSLFGSDDSEISVTATNLLPSSGWNLALESYVKDTTSTWQTSDIEYEVLVDEKGEIIADSTNSPIYTL